MAFYSLDCSFQLCPVPILMTEERMQSLKTGDVLEVLFTDPGAKEDLEAWCRMAGHEFFGLRKEKICRFEDPEERETWKKNLKKSVLVTARALRRAKKIMVVSHVNPDGDTLGCLLALGLALMQAGKKVSLLCHDAVPTRFQYLPGSELVGSPKPRKARCGRRGRLREPAAAGLDRGRVFPVPCTVQIDHHDFGDAFGKIQLLDPEASAVGEIVYDLLRALGTEITPAIATCLLTSIIIDTGAFRFSNIRAKTFDICARLVKKGVDIQHLIEEAYWVKSRPMALLSGHAVSRAVFSANGSVAWADVSQRDIVHYGAGLSDADSVADDLRSIQEWRSPRFSGKRTKGICA